LCLLPFALPRSEAPVEDRWESGAAGAPPCAASKFLRRRFSSKFSDAWQDERSSSKESLEAPDSFRGRRLPFMRAPCRCGGTTGIPELMPLQRRPLSPCCASQLPALATAGGSLAAPPGGRPCGKGGPCAMPGARSFGAACIEGLPYHYLATSE